MGRGSKPSLWSAVLEISPSTAPLGHSPGLAPHCLQPRGPPGRGPASPRRPVYPPVSSLLASPVQPQARGGAVRPHGPAPADHAHHRHQPERTGQPHAHQAGKAQASQAPTSGPSPVSTQALRWLLRSPRSSPQTPRPPVNPGFTRQHLRPPPSTSPARTLLASSTCSPPIGSVPAPQVSSLSLWPLPCVGAAVGKQVGPRGRFWRALCALWK